jgi:hypothetical protein
MLRYSRTCSLIFASMLWASMALAQQDFISTFIGGGPSSMPAVDADLNFPTAIAVDSAGTYYIAAQNAHRVFKVTSTGTITLIAGNGIAGYTGDGVVGKATQAELNTPIGIGVDSAKNVYVSDYNNFVIRKIDTAGTITTIAGIQGQCSFTGDGGPATSATICHAGMVTPDTAGNLYIGDGGNCRVRKVVLSSGIISTYAGTTCGYSGDGGLATAAKLSNPFGVVEDNSGNVYIADTNNYVIRKVTNSTGIITTIAGTNHAGFSGDGGLATIAQISTTYRLAVNAAGNTVTIADYGNNRVRQFTVGGNILTVAGSGFGGFCGDGALATSACMTAHAIGFNSGGTYFVADASNNRIRSFTIGGNINTVAGNGSTNQATIVNGVAPTGVTLQNPYGIFRDPNGNFFVSDMTNNVIRELVKSTNVVNTFAGTGVQGYSGDGGPAISAQVRQPTSVARDKSGNIYIADQNNHIIRMVNTAGIISTFAGTPQSCGYSGDGGPATSAKLCTPVGVFVDSKNNVYIADWSNHVIREVSNGTINTIAGNGTGGYLGDGGPAITARLNHPASMAVDSSGNVFIADEYNHRIREVTAATGIITTVAGTGVGGFNGDGEALFAELQYPQGVILDANENLFIADTNNHRVRWLSPDGILTTFGGLGFAGFNGDGIMALQAELFYPSAVTQDTTGNVYVADQSNWRIRQINAFAALDLSDDNIGFPLTPVGSLSAPAIVTLSSIGPLTIPNVAITGPFSEYDDCPFSLSNGSTCTMNIFFQPTAAGNQTGSVTVYTNGYFNTQSTIVLSGVGTAIQVTGGPLSFGNQQVKTTSAAKTITVKNTGTKAVSMGAITLTDATDYVFTSNTCPASGQNLNAGASCTLGIAFSPKSTGLKKGSVVINDGDPTSPQLVGLTGTGTSNVVLNPLSLALPNEPVGTTSPSSKIILTNNTGGTLTLSNPAVTITGPFVLANTTSCTNGLVIVAGGTCNLFVQFKPTAVGFVTGTVSVADSDSTSPQVASLSGIGTGVQFAPATVNFGTVNRGVKVTSTVTITNVGTTTVNFDFVSITGANRLDFGFTGNNPPCTSLLPGAACTFSVTFTPSLVGKENGTFGIYDNSAGSPQTLPLTGTGQ